jgi:hypothetical protein
MNMRIAKMTGLYNARLAELSPEDLHSLKQRAHLERSEAARDLFASGFSWLAGVVREAGWAARLSEAPRPYGEPRRTCG